MSGDTVFNFKILFRVINRAAFANYINLNLTRILKLVFNLFNYVTSHNYHLVIAYCLGFYKNSDLTACLNCIRIFNAVKGIGDFL